MVLEYLGSKRIFGEDSEKDTITNLDPNWTFYATDTLIIYFWNGSEWVETPAVVSTGLIFGGAGPNATSEEFNGEIWSSSNNLVVAVDGPGRGSCGNAGNSVCVAGFDGGSNVNNTQEYTGVVWNTGGVYPIATSGSQGGGDSIDSIQTGGGGGTTTSNIYNGTAWSSTNAIGQNRNNGTGGGDSSDAIIMGGTGASLILPCEEFNGTSWANGGNITQARRQLGGGGDTTDAICFAGFNNSTGVSTAETYNGTTWSAITNVGTATNQVTGGGNSSDALYCPCGNTASQIWNGTSWITTLPMIASRCNAGGGYGK